MVFTKTNALHQIEYFGFFNILVAWEILMIKRFFLLKNCNKKVTFFNASKSCICNIPNSFVFHFSYCFCLQLITIPKYQVDLIRNLLTFGFKMIEK